jgi:ABC-type transport system involved in cytochrome c biogenesis permease subunit
MKTFMKLLPVLIGIVLFAGYAASKARLPKDNDKSAVYKHLKDITEKAPETIPNVYQFAELPMVYEGRLKPFDSLARNTLRVLSDSEDIYRPANDTDNLSAMSRMVGSKKIKVPPAAWLLDMISNHKRSLDYRIFRIHNTDLIKTLKLEEKKEYNFKYSFGELRNEEIEHKHDGHSHKAVRMQIVREEAGKVSGVDQKKRTPYQTAVLRLANQLSLYTGIQNSFITNDIPEESIVFFYNELSKFIGRSFPRPIPTVTGEWESAIFMNVRRFNGDEANNCWANFSLMMDAWRKDNYADFNKHLTDYETALETSIEKSRDFLTSKATKLEFREKNISEELGGLSGKEYEEKEESIRTYIFNSRKYLDDQNELWGISLKKMKFERYFNSFSPFYISIVFYVMIFIICCLGLLFNPKAFWKMAMTGLVITFVIHSFAVWCRYYISGYPPVTNLYSSAVFIGWGVAGVGLLLEVYFRKYFGLLVTSIAGVCCLIIAQNLAAEGDTMGMMRAVLDTKFWLATHVITVTLGYTATFLAGGIAVYWFFGKLFGGITKDMEKEIVKAIYGVICYGMFLSFVGTVLGGLWADDSWGRFWGWDPKENGALMIVIWNAVFLHAKWSGMARVKGVMCLACFGAVITAWSWFGVNLLGVGLHSYGFTSSGRFYLLLFAGINIAVIAIIMLPLEIWKSHREEPAEELFDEVSSI